MYNIYTFNTNTEHAAHIERMFPHATGHYDSLDTVSWYMYVPEEDVTTGRLLGRLLCSLTSPCGDTTNLCGGKESYCIIIS